jgi:hypothetical protein
MTGPLAETHRPARARDDAVLRPARILTAVESALIEGRASGQRARQGAESSATSFVCLDTMARKSETDGWVIAWSIVEYPNRWADEYV